MRRRPRRNIAGLALDGMRQVGFGAAGVELSLRSRWFALTALILLPLSRRLRRGADADLCDVAALPPLVAPMFGLAAVEILGDAGVHDPVAMSRNWRVAVAIHIKSRFTSASWLTSESALKSAIPATLRSERSRVINW